MIYNNLLKKTTILIGLLIYVVCLVGQVPQRPNPPRLVNDFANVFSKSQQAELENLLIDFSNQTSNQIVVVTMTDFEGNDKAQLAYEIGQTWGVGNKEFNNGIVILLKPKNETHGEVFIATGYGLEGALPDATCKDIVEYEMIPLFKENDYYGGVRKAVDIITKIAQGEYYEPTKEEAGWAEILASFIIFIVFVVVIILANKNSGGRGSNYTRAGVAGAIISGLGKSSGGRSSRGGFGGFGGGSFGGGGAGGRW